VGHYGDGAYGWDVVNEAITDDCGAEDPLKSSVWYPAVPDSVDVAFREARSAAPAGVKLFYNDYNVASSAGWSKCKSDKLYSMAKSMIARGVPIDGVGLQMHVRDGWGPDWVAGVQANMERLGALGLEVHVTELDVSCNSSIGCDWGPEAEKQQASLYASLLKACLAVKACKNFETWGFTDKYTWMTTALHPLPFDEKLVPKAAVAAMLNQLQSAGAQI
jgi:endo-1,4-beta-xylanase